MQVAVIGANGQVARILCKKLSLLAETVKVTAFVRNPVQFSQFEQYSNFRASTSIDLASSSQSDITKALVGFDAVVFSAGAGGKGLDKTIAVDLDGAVRVAQAVESNRIPKFILVSAIKSLEREFWWDSPIKSYYIAKKYADEYIINQLHLQNYLILQPGVLLNTEETGKIELPGKVNSIAEQFKDDSTKYSIPRGDVAQVIVELLSESNGLHNQLIPLISGHVPIAEALK